MYPYGDKELERTNAVDYSDSESEDVTQSPKPPSDSSPIRSTYSSNAASQEHRLPESVNEFFQTVRMGCFPEDAGMDTKAQPWRRIWGGPQPPAADGKLIVACPKNCVWGSGSGLGGY